MSATRIKSSIQVRGVIPATLASALACAVLAITLPSAAHASGFWTTTRSAGLTNGFLYGADFVDASNGWVVGQFEYGDVNKTTETRADPVIQATHDAGATWTTQSGALGLPSGFLTSVDFADANNGWVVGREGRGVDPNPDWKSLLLRTVDGGATWVRQQVPIAGPTALWSVYTLDANRAWVVGTRPNEGSFVLKTLDGTNWEQVGSLPVGSGELYGVTFVNELQGWVVGWEDVTPDGYPVILSTADGGATWSKQTFPQYKDGKLHAVTFVDALNGWAVGREDNWLRHVAPPLIMHTSDGGASWSPQQTGNPNADLRSVVFPDASRGWAVGTKGGDTGIPYVVHTEDGGANWAEETVGAEAALLQSVTFDRSGNGWSVGYVPASDGSASAAAKRGPRGIVLAHHARDRHRPRTIARRASARRGQVARLQYRIVDPAPSIGFATARIAISRRGRVVKRVRAGRVRTNRALTKRLRANLAPGQYSYGVGATDAAGNRARRIRSATLIITP